MNFANFYKNFRIIISKTKTITGFIIFIIIASVLLFSFSKKELLPQEDRGAYLIIGSTDEGSSFEYTQEQALKVGLGCFPYFKRKIVHIQDL